MLHAAATTFAPADQTPKLHARMFDDHTARLTCPNQLVVWWALMSYITNARARSLTLWSGGKPIVTIVLQIGEAFISCREVARNPKVRVSAMTVLRYLRLWAEQGMITFEPVHTPKGKACLGFKVKVIDIAAKSEMLHPPLKQQTLQNKGFSDEKSPVFRDQCYTTREVYNPEKKRNSHISSLSDARARSRVDPEPLMGESLEDELLADFTCDQDPCSAPAVSSHNAPFSPCAGATTPPAGQAHKSEVLTPTLDEARLMKKYTQTTGQPISREKRQEFIETYRAGPWTPAKIEAALDFVMKTPRLRDTLYGINRLFYTAVLRSEAKKPAPPSALESITQSAYHLLEEMGRCTTTPDQLWGQIVKTGAEKLEEVEYLESIKDLVLGSLKFYVG